MSGCLCTGACIGRGYCPLTQTAPPAQITVSGSTSPPLTEETVRRIVREEIGRVSR